MKYFVHYQIKLLFRERFFTTALYQYALLVILVYFVSTHFNLTPEIIYWGTIFLMCSLDEKYLINLFSLFRGELKSLVFYTFNIDKYLLGKEFIWCSFFFMRVIGLSLLVKNIHWYNWTFYLITLPIFYSISILVSGLFICVGIQFIWRVLFYILSANTIIVIYFISNNWLLKIIFIIIAIALNGGAIYISQNFLKNCEEVVYGSYSYSEFN